MTTDQLDKSATDEHAELVVLIPWYVKGTLTPAEYEQVQQHLTQCELCRQEVADCAALAEHVPAAEERWAPSAAHFADILASVEKLEAEQAKPQPAPEFAAAGWLTRVGAWLSQTPNPVRWTLAVESLALAALLLFVVLPPQPGLSPAGGFETLSDAPAPRAAAGQSIRVVFAEDMTLHELSELLKQSRTQIRQGPSAVGSYTVEAATADAAAALAILHAHPKVRLAQPLETAAGP